MGLNKRRVTRLVLALLVLLLCVALFDALRLRRDQGWNALIAAGQMPTDSPAEARAEARAKPQAPEHVFAWAHAQAASGATDAALDRYLGLQGDSPLGQAARYNSANLLLRQAVKVRESSDAGQALPLIELAKATYREVLRHDPGHWNARYNLERAQRLLPDPEDADDGAPDVPRAAERAATTMRGFSPGLP